MLHVISWILIVIMALLYLVCLISPITTVKTESKNSYLLLTTLLYSTMCIFPLKEIYSTQIAARIWQWTFIIEFIFSILIVFVCRDKKTNAIVTMLISTGLLVIPFVNCIQFSKEPMPFDVAPEKFEIRIEYLISVLGLIATCIIIGCTFVIIRRTNRTGYDYKLTRLLQENIAMFSNQASFKQPMETLWSYEANSKLRQLDLLIKKCISEVQSLSQKPFIPNSIYSFNMDELRPMIYNMSAEISKLNSIVAKNETQGTPPSDFSIMTELNHSLATPLSQIEVNCQLLKAKTKGSASYNLDKIVQYVNFCRRTILAYKELLSSTVAGDSSDYKDILQDCFKMYCEKYGKEKLSIRFESDEKLLISRNIIMSLISPLLENAVTASPEEKEIIIDIRVKEDYIEISISNFCYQVPKETDLQTSGYSSKANHIGTGLDTVRHLLSLIGGQELKSTISKNIICFTILLPKECGQKFQK